MADIIHPEKFVNRQILDEFEWMVKKFQEIWMDYEVARAKVIKIQRDKYNKI